MTRPFDPNEIRRQRVARLLGDCMAERGIDLWLVYSRESSRDPLGRDVGLERVVARGAGLFALQGGEVRRHALVASYDTSPVEASGIYQEITAYKQEGISPHLKRAFEALQPKRVAINVSRDVAVADGLSHGMRLHLDEILGPGFGSLTVSSEPLVVSFRCRKLPEELESLRRSVLLTQELYNQALTPAIVRPGLTREIDLAAFLEKGSREAGASVAFCHVMVGPCRGHSDPTDRVIQPGDLIRIDFGTFVDGYSSDIQRTAYVLRPGESGPPPEVSRLFEATLRANRAGIAALQPGAKGRDVDHAARSVLVDAGYEEYPHATGHPIGLETHELGPILGPPWKERYGTSVEHPIEPGMVFAVEPMAYPEIPACGGVVQVGLEENVEITLDGPKIIGTPQEALILLPS
jgi:Xaa-Pro aminopeptidase